jgi:hypothetical protein
VLSNAGLLADDEPRQVAYQIRTSLIDGRGANWCNSGDALRNQLLYGGFRLGDAEACAAPVYLRSTVPSRGKVAREPVFPVGLLNERLPRVPDSSLPLATVRRTVRNNQNDQTSEACRFHRFAAEKRNVQRFRPTSQ